MTDLTEQWKKGELPSGWYYTKLWKGCNVIDYFIGNQFLRYDDSDIEEVLAEVPSFEELQNMNKAVNECMAANIKLVEQNAQLKEQIERLEKQYDRAKWCLNEIVKNYRFTPISTAEKALKDLSELENA